MVLIRTRYSVLCSPTCITPAGLPPAACPLCSLSGGQCNAEEVWIYIPLESSKQFRKKSRLPLASGRTSLVFCLAPSFLQ